MLQSMIGKNFGRYQIVEELGQGGMAVVYKALDTVLERHVAIKMILPGQQQSDKFLKRFQREARTLAQLSHPNIVKVLDFGEYEGVPYLVMEYIPGGSLSDRMGRAFTCEEAAAVLVPVARALHSAHTHKIIHRDVKPANILFNEGGQATLSDFGIVKLIDAEEGQTLTGTGVMVGTPSYMAPEQITGGQIDGRVDIYALGVIFFELVTGRKPYIAKTPIEITLKHLNEPVPRPRQFVRDLPPEADQIVMKSMAKSPEDRYPNMEVFAQVLERLAQGPQAVGRVTSKPLESAKPAKESEKPTSPASDGKTAPQAAAPGRSKKLFAVLGGVALVVIVAAVAFLALQGQIPGLKGTAIAGVGSTSTLAATATESAALEPTPAPTQTLPPTQAATATTAPSATATPLPTPAAATSTPLASVCPKCLGPSDLKTVVELSRLEKISVIQVDWTPDGQWIIDAGSKGLSLIDPNTMTSAALISLGNDVPKNIAISGDSKTVTVLLGSTVRTFDIATRKEISSFPVQGGANSMALSTDRSLIALGMLDSKVLLVDSVTGSVKRTLRSNYGGWSVAFSPDGKYVAVGTSQGVLMWETATGTWLPINSGQESLIKRVTFSNDGKLLAGGGEGAIYIWEVESGDEVMKFSGLFGAVNALDFLPDDRLLLSGTTDTIVRAWDVNARREAAQFKSHTSPVFSVVFSPQGDFFVSGANEGVIRRWGKP